MTSPSRAQRWEKQRLVIWPLVLVRLIWMETGNPGTAHSSWSPWLREVAGRQPNIKPRFTSERHILIWSGKLHTSCTQVEVLLRASRSEQKQVARSCRVLIWHGRVAIIGRTHFCWSTGFYKQVFPYSVAFVVVPMQDGTYSAGRERWQGWT